MSKAMTYTERLRLEVYYNEGYSKAVIAQKMKKSVRSIFYELQRGYYERLDSDTWKTIRAYSPDIADKKAKWCSGNKGRPIKLDRNYKFVTTLSTLIRDDKRSPYHVSHYCKENEIMSVSPSTIYRYIDRGYIPGVTNKDLPEWNKRKRKYNKVRRAARPPKGMSIEERPDISSRDEFGHWEMDTVIGMKKGKGQAILVLTERKTRYEMIFKLMFKDMKSVNGRLLRLLNQVREMVPFKSITVDNGTEFAGLVSVIRDVPIYYCHPFSSCERASNERNNRDIRRQIPKGVNMKLFNQTKLSGIEHWLNTMYRPRSIQTTSEAAFCAEVQKWKKQA